MKKVFNFSAGPSMLPEQVKAQIKTELYNWHNLGISVMEISHRSLEFIELAQNAQQNLRMLLNIPWNYKILFCHGGARAQFSAIPMNLLQKSTDKIDYINTGFWSYNAAVESKKFCNPYIINVLDNTKNKLNFIKPIPQWAISKDSRYIHYCPNETINGVSIDDIPDCFDKVVIADCSSMLLSCPLEIDRFGLIYASAQKNIGISGLTVLIIREDLINLSNNKKIPSVLNYQILSQNDSMFNTPVTISWYIADLIFKWLQNQGGLHKIQECNQIKSSFLYHTIDTHDLYYNNIDPKNRSYMNVPFFLKKENLNYLFLKESENFGLYGLKGHKAIGGMRASLYNAMPLEGVQALVTFMKWFSKKYN